MKRLFAFPKQNMSAKLCCCLCCTSVISEYKYLQNDSGECNDVYEITVKYFDPMLLTDDMNTLCSTETRVLCQNCWVHIQDFYDFQQMVLKKRASLEHIKLEKVQISTVVYDNNDADNEELVQLNKLLIKNDSDADNNFEKDFDIFKDGSEDDQSSLSQSRTETNNETGNQKANNLKQKDKTHSCKVLKSKKSLKGRKKLEPAKNDDSSVNNNLSRTKKNFKASSKKADFHPTLDKGREYDKFIAEWKSQLECDICSETFPIFDLLKVHFKNEHNTKAYVKCCDRKFERRCSLVEHIRLHINPEMHKCDICGKLSGSKYSLQHHKKTLHEESQKFKCNECPKVFKQKQNLKCHLLTHVTGNKDFKCNECDKAYVLEFQLKKHIKLVHVDNRICDQCGKTLHGIGALKNHLKEHEDIEKPKYPCDECGAELGSRITLKRHKASYHNDGSTVYVCSLCGKVSSTERALKNHKKYVHEIERKYKCPHCDKAFKRAQNLQEHIATHTGEALYQCPQCPRTFKINSKYHEHRKKSHPIEWEEGRKNRLEKQKIDFERVKNQVVI